MISTDLRGKTTALPGCATCFASSVAYSYGLGIVTTGNWLMQDPLFSGRGRCLRLPAVAEGGDRPGAHVRRGRVRAGRKLQAGGHSNAADAVWREIATVLAPNDPPPTR